MDTEQNLLNVRLCGASHVGNVRRQNQDRYLYGKIAPQWQVTTNMQAFESTSTECVDFYGQIFLAAVADGMGGHADGSMAADIAIRTFLTELAHRIRTNAVTWTSIEWQSVLSQAIVSCQRMLLQYQREHTESRGMGTTFTAVTIVNSYAYIAHLGDSRCYLWENGVLRRVTHDHNLAQLMVDEGVMTEEQAATTDYGNRLYNALGNFEESGIPDLHVVAWLDHTKILLCSNGLSNDISDEEIESILTSDHTSDEMCEILVERAFLHAGRDNITVVLATRE